MIEIEELKERVRVLEERLKEHVLWFDAHEEGMVRPGWVDEVDTQRAK